jgi:glycosyltransferase involved in cell wall biosynthesis
VGIHPWRKLSTQPLIPINTVRIARLLRRIRPDVIHVNDFWAMPWIHAACLLSRLRPPVVCHIRNPVGRRRVRNYRLRFADAVVTMSRALEEEFGHWSPPEREKVQTLYDGIDFARLDRMAPERDVRAEQSIPPEAKIILQVGHISRRKNQMTAVDAWERLPQTLRERTYILFLGGRKEHEPDYADALAERIGRPVYGGRVRWIDFDPEVAPYYRVCDLMTLPSRSEGLGLVSLEAMHFGRPVVASDVEGIPDVVRDGETGYLVPVDDADALADRFARLLQDDALGRRLGAAGRERAHTVFGLEAYAGRMMDLYDRLVEGAAAGR